MNVTTGDVKPRIMPKRGKAGQPGHAARVAERQRKAMRV